MTPGLDWQRPWFAPWRGVGEPVETALAAGRPPHEALNGVGPGPVRFVPQDDLPAGSAYEQFVFETGRCPVRPGAHDFFNALVWLRMPQAKRRLNELQAAQIRAGGIGGRRGPVRDAITVFDENGALLHAPAPLWQALRARDWHGLFVTLRPLWAQARILVFGHALLEKLASPRKDLTAHVWDADAPLPSLEAADAWLAARCSGEVLAAKPFTPLPLLGIPGWWPANENLSFYADSLVFRPPRGTGAAAKPNGS